jgi:hypothetical protein
VSGCQAGAAAAREISMEQEEPLQQLVKWWKHRRIVQREPVYNEADTMKSLIRIVLDADASVQGTDDSMQPRKQSRMVLLRL